MTEHSSIYTNGTWKNGSGPFFTSHNPATNEILWEGHEATKEEVDEVIQNARKASADWINLSIDERLKYLNQFAEILKLEQALLSETISKETGKPLWESKAEVDSMISKIQLSAEAYGRRCAGMMSDQAKARSITRHKPHGIIGVIGPFNFPAHLPNGHIIPALLAGNTVIFKPSELTPLVAEVIIQFWEKAGLPHGVIHLIQGGKETGQALVHHPDLNGLFFTGSYSTGKMLSELFGTQPQKILALEMGGNNPFIVSQISNIDLAAFLTIQSAYITAGQRCTCARRLIVPRSKIGEDYIQKLVEMINKITIGPYTNSPEPYMGPLICESHALKVLQAQKELAIRGGKTLVQMRSINEGTGFLNPGLMDVTDVQERIDEEIFGPFLQLIWVDNFEEAIEEANRTKYGLAAGLLSDSTQEYDLFYRRIKAGIVNWNTQLTGASSAAPFGGIGCSGNHRPSGYYAADYCSYPVASLETPRMQAPLVFPPGLKITLNEDTIK